jgi:hypothetical protein
MYVHIQWTCICMYVGVSTLKNFHFTAFFSSISSKPRNFDSFCRFSFFLTFLILFFDENDELGPML